jgi:methylglyoxal reductase
LEYKLENERSQIAMRKNIEIGKSGIFVPFLGLGTWAIGGGSWWGDNDDRISIQTIQEAIDLGIVWIDTAPIYGLYHSESVVGQAVREHRKDIVLSTKCALQWRNETPIFHKNVDGTDVYRDLSKKGIIEDVEHSLKTLGTDYIDVLYTHWQTTDKGIYPIEETMDAMMTLKKQGKIRAIGASNVTEEDIREYCKYGQLDVIQEKYSIATRRVEKELMPVCQELGVSIQAYSPLEQGLLTGKFTMDTVFPEGDVRNNNPSFKMERRAAILDILGNWKKYLEKYECSYSNLVIALTAQMIDSLHVLGGARKPEQIEDNVKALQIELEEDDIRQMKKDIEVLENV